MTWFHRIYTSAKLASRSSMIMTNAGTILVAIFLTPALDLVFSVLLGSSLGSPDLLRIAYAGALVQSCLMVASSMCTSLTFDKTEDISQEVISRRVVDIPYWIGLGLPGLLASLGTALFSICCILLFSGGAERVMAARCLGLLIPAMLAGFCLGVFVSGLGLPLKDSFSALNLVAALLPITSGTVVPLSSYPPALRTLCKFLPVSPTVASLSTGQPWLSTLWAEVVRGCVCLALGLAASRWAWKLMRRGQWESEG